MVVIMIRFEHISAGYNGEFILKDINLDIREQCFYGIIGPNGTGKTTLLRLLTGIKKPDQGKVLLQGKDIGLWRKKDVAKTMAVVPQSSFIPPMFSVAEVVAMGRYPYKNFAVSGTDTDRKAVASAIEKTGIANLKHKLMHELSGGQRQEVIIARALAQKPRILVLDEPTSNLDIGHQIELLTLTRSLVKHDQMTAVMVIHDLNLAARFCDELILLNDQKILSWGAARQVLTPENLQKAYGIYAVVHENRLTHSPEITVLDSMALDSTVSGITVPDNTVQDGNVSDIPVKELYHEV